MYWQADYSQPSPVDVLLDKEEFTLEALLEEDDLIQEAKSLNGRLIDFLKQKETVAQLLALIVEPADGGILFHPGRICAAVKALILALQSNLDLHCFTKLDATACLKLRGILLGGKADAQHSLQQDCQKPRLHRQLQKQRELSSTPTLLANSSAAKWTPSCQRCLRMKFSWRSFSPSLNYRSLLIACWQVQQDCSQTLSIS